MSMFNGSKQDSKSRYNRVLTVKIVIFTVISPEVLSKKASIGV